MDDHNGIVTAIATAFIAAFTWTLWKSNEKMWRITDATFKHAEKTSQRLILGLWYDAIHFENAIVMKDGQEILARVGPVKYFDWNYGRTPAVNVVMMFAPKLATHLETLVGIAGRR